MTLPPTPARPTSPATEIVGAVGVIVGVPAIDAVLNSDAPPAAHLLRAAGIWVLIVLLWAATIPRPSGYGGILLPCGRSQRACLPELVVPEFGRRGYRVPWCPHRTEVTWHPATGDLVAIDYRVLPPHRPASLQEIANTRTPQQIRVRVDPTAGAAGRRAALKDLHACLVCIAVLTRTARWRLTWAMWLSTRHRPSGDQSGDGRNATHTTTREVKP